VLFEFLVKYMRGRRMGWREEGGRKEALREIDR
jgi:hypothetical protein